MKPLKGIRILDLTKLSGYCGMELADYGAEVIKIEQPDGGDPIRRLKPIKNKVSPYHLYRDRGKKSITLDLNQSGDREIFKELILTADAVIENYQPGTMEAWGLDYQSLSILNPTLVYGRITAYGSKGEEHDTPYSDLIAQAKSGVMHFTGFPENPPTRIGFKISEHYASSFMASAICIAIFHAVETGKGQYLETSLAGSVIAISEDKVITYGAENEDPMRTGNAHPLINPYDILKCKNGYVAMGISSDAQWAKFCKAFGTMAWLDDDKYCSNLVRGYHYFGDLRDKIEELFSNYTMQEISKICDDALIPGTMCSTTKEALAEPQLHARNMIIDVKNEQIGNFKMPGRPIKISGEDEEDFKSAPSLGEDNNEILNGIQELAYNKKRNKKRLSGSKERPLDGIKILDFSQVLAAPFCGMLLADMGAEVIKVERPGTGDISREYGPYINDISLYFCQYNRGKKGIAIDMRNDEGKKLVMELVKDVDIVIENFKFGTLEKLGIGYEEMIKINPEIIYGSISGFGTYGPLSHLPCMDIIAAARSGLVGTSGEDGEAPIKPGFSLCDTWAGLQLLRGLSMALLNKQKTGKGMRVDIAMLDCAFYMCEEPILDYSTFGEFTKRSGNHDPYYAPFGEFATSDGNVVITVTDQEQWKNLCQFLEAGDMYKDERFKDNESRLKNRDVLIKNIENYTKKLGRYDIEKGLLARNIPASAVQSLAEFDRNPQTKILDVITKVNQPGVGEYTAVNTPIYFSKTPVDPNSSAPSFPGFNTLEVLEKIGKTSEEIERLLNSGAVSVKER